MTTDNGQDPESFSQENAEDGQLAAATIISDDTASSEGSLGSNQNLEDDNQTEILDDDAPDLQVSEGAVDSESQSSSKPKAFFKRKRSIIGGVASGILVILCIGGAGLIGRSPRIDPVSVVPVQMYLSTIDGVTSDVFYLDRFIILFSEDSDRAYLTLSVAITPSNKDVFNEIKAKRAVCRRAIYDIVRKAVADSKKLLKAKNRLEQDMLNALNAVLTKGTIERVELSDFLVV